ncbi:hypothetical protein [Thioalkalivibrio sp. ALE11]|uniref:hypothetical protein n=1 Tax=Thioalkalivibrio sp. ALE11 TaxID=1265494 RepID=UPI00035DA6C0|nr:hypothetical protein [Thioalkalivibrio sp. ALE11]
MSNEIAFKELVLHPEFVRIKDGSRVVLLHESEFVKLLAALRQYEALRDHLGGDPLVDAGQERDEERE